MACLRPPLPPGSGPGCVPAVDPTRGRARIARAGVLGGAGLFLAAGAHVLAGGALPGAGLLTVVGVLLALVAVSLTGRRRRFGDLLAVLAAEQASLHVVFAAASSGSCVSSGGGMAGHAGMSSVSCLPGATHHLVAGPSMWLAHAVALVATAWLLSCGEQWLWRVCDDLGRLATARPSRRRPRAVRTVTPAVAGFQGSARWVLVPARAPPLS